MTGTQKEKHQSLKIRTKQMRHMQSTKNRKMENNPSLTIVPNVIIDNLDTGVNG